MATDVQIALTNSGAVWSMAVEETSGQGMRWLSKETTLFDFFKLKIMSD
ncbi:hypothetical protein [Okeania hirsuta]|nr:hypothetical protein [Okeania hirsuta]